MLHVWGIENSGAVHVVCLSSVSGICAVGLCGRAFCVVPGSFRSRLLLVHCGPFESGVAVMVRFLLLALLLAPSGAFAEVVSCASACTMTFVVSIDAFPAMTPEQVADYMELWGKFILVGVVVVCLKAIYARFRLSKYEG